jgi:hypothetical protein
MTPALPSTPLHRRAYDHRLREHVYRTGARALGHGLHVPRSTVSTWKRRGLRSVVTLEPFQQDRQQLLCTIEKLKTRVQILAAAVRLLRVPPGFVSQASGFPRTTPRRASCVLSSAHSRHDRAQRDRDPAHLGDRLHLWLFRLAATDVFVLLVGTSVLENLLCVHLHVRDGSVGLVPVISDRACFLMSHISHGRADRLWGVAI